MIINEDDGNHDGGNHDDNDVNGDISFIIHLMHHIELVLACILIDF
jgi:hypothetical protein